MEGTVVGPSQRRGQWSWRSSALLPKVQVKGRVKGASSMERATRYRRVVKRRIRISAATLSSSDTKRSQLESSRGKSPRAEIPQNGVPVLGQIVYNGSIASETSYPRNRIRRRSYRGFYSLEPAQPHFLISPADKPLQALLETRLALASPPVEPVIVV
ncbi:hypothetical protein KM043_012659 [Ampulex compressa]|nr:hypothetical protein KM043_012659 [Ampulex compressa]